MPNEISPKFNMFENVGLTNNLKDYARLVKNAGGRLYYDTRLATGTGVPGSFSSPNVLVDLLGGSDLYTLTNILGANGNFGTDAGSGLGVGWAGSNAGNYSVADNVQFFTATAQYGNVQYNIVPVSGSIYYMCGYVKTSKGNTYMSISGTSFTTGNSSNHSGSGNFEFLSARATATGSVQGAPKIVDGNSSAWAQVQVKQIHVLNLTAIFGAGNEPTNQQMDWIIQRQGYINSQSVLWPNNASLINFQGTSITDGYDITKPKTPGLVFDGSDSICTLINTPSLDITSAPLAIFATIKVPDPISSTGYIISKNNSAATDMQYGMFIEAVTNNLVVYLEGNTSRITINLAGYLGKVVNVGFIWDGTNVYGYRDGVLRAVGGFTGTLTSRPYIRIGRRETSAIYFKGYLYTLAIYSGIQAAKANILKAEQALSQGFF